MADPLSIAGSAAGLISLGIQVCSGITLYLDSIRCRPGDIASVKQQVQNLEAVVRVIETIIPKVDSSHQLPITAVVECLRSCEAELDHLQSFITQLTGGDTPPTNFKGEVQKQTRKLTYPFNRPKLDELRNKLHTANGILQTALQCLNLLPNFRRSLDSLETSISTQTSTVSFQVKDNIQQLQGTLQSSWESSWGSTQIQLNRIEQTIQDQRQSALLSNIERMVSELHLQGVAGPAQEQRVNSERAVRRLVAKPGNLSALCDDVSNLSRASNTHHNGPSAPMKSPLFSSSITLGKKCVCRQRKRYQFRQWRWGPFEFFNEATLVNGHLPESELSQILKGDQHRSLGLKYTGIATLTSRAVKMAFSMTTGSGGFSISPNVMYYPVVDSEEAPAFKLLHILRNYLQCEGYRIDPSEIKTQALLEKVLRKIIALFHERKASPADVDSNNKSLLHFVGNLITSMVYNGYCVSLLVELFSSLSNYGVPMTYDDYGSSPLHPVFHLLETSELATAEALLLRGIDIPLLSIGPGPKRRIIFSPTKPLSVVRSSIRWAEAYGCGPLSLAIIGKEPVDQVEQFLTYHLSAIQERNMDDETPLHLAADKPEYLQLLVRFADDRLLNGMHHKTSDSVSWQMESGRTYHMGCDNATLSTFSCYRAIQNRACANQMASAAV